MHKFLVSLLPFLALAACAAPPRGEAPATVETPGAAAGTAEPAPAGETWTVVASHLSVRAYRDGPMQKLGHDHLITSDGLVGTIALGAPISQTRFELRVPLESLVVDDEAARAAAGGIFAAPVPQKDRDATRHNLLGEKLLDAARQDSMRLTAESLSGDGGRYEARVRVSLAGHDSVVGAPFTVAIDGDRLEAHAALRLTHADLGLEPFTVALGALRVREDIDVDLKLEAKRGS
jgi:hypothetical protein